MMLKVMCGISLQTESCLVNHLVAGAWASHKGSHAPPDLTKGDEIIALDGKPVLGADDLRTRLQDGRVRVSISLTSLCNVGH